MYKLPLNKAILNVITWKYQQKLPQNLKINPKINRKTYSQDNQDDFLKKKEGDLATRYQYFYKDVAVKIWGKSK